LIVVGNALLALPTLSAAQKAQITQLIAAIQQAVAKIDVTAPTISPQTTNDVRAFVQLCNSLITSASTIVATIPGIPPAISIGLAAAAVLLPIIESALNIPHIETVPPSPLLTPDEARDVLKRLSAT
jgi:hypothetical protein